MVALPRTTVIVLNSCLPLMCNWVRLIADVISTGSIHGIVKLSELVNAHERFRTFDDDANTRRLHIFDALNLTKLHHFNSCLTLEYYSFGITSILL